MKLPQSRWTHLLIGILMLSVFSWGLAYKLSLYEPQTASIYKVPIAKLLSENERTEAKTAPASTAEYPGTIRAMLCAALTLWFTTLLPLHRQPSAEQQSFLRRPDCRLRRKLPQPAPAPFFSRPPPRG